MSEPILAFQAGAASAVDGDPTGVYTPALVGQIAFDAATGSTYVAAGVTAADWVQSGGGGGSQGVVKYKLDFAFDTPGLNDGVAIPGYTPKDGDIILVGTQIVGATDWDGTTPMADLYFGSEATQGYFTYAGATLVGMNSIAHVDATSGLRGPSTEYYQVNVGGDKDAAYIVVSQDGSKGGADPEATQGAATVVIVVVPAAA